MLCKQFKEKKAINWLLQKYAEDLEQSGQLLVVVSKTNDPGNPNASLYVCDRTANDESWQTGKPIDVTIGKKGFCRPGEKQEGDNRSPQGLFNLGYAYGYAKTFNTGLDYRQAGDSDIWIDDPGHPEYNTWSTFPTDAASWERMKRDDHQYKMGIIIEYNTQPVLKNRGSAVFMHIWEAPGYGTSACVAMDEENLTQIMKWLNKKHNPKILMGCPDDLLLMR